MLKDTIGIREWIMQGEQITEKDREMAQRCVDCPICTRARVRQRGLAFWFVKYLEKGMCPYCRAYEKVYGRKAHEPEPGER